MGPRVPATRARRSQRRPSSTRHLAKRGPATGVEPRVRFVKCLDRCVTPLSPTDDVGSSDYHGNCHINSLFSKMARSRTARSGVLILGGGFAGAYVARHRRLSD